MDPARSGMTPLSFVVWRWDENNGRSFPAEAINVLRARVRMHYALPHRFICVTDKPAGLDPDIEIVPMPALRFEGLKNPSEIRRNRRGFVVQSTKRLPQCYRRLWNFSAAAARVLGPRIFALDADVIPVADLVPLVSGHFAQADFVGWSDPKFGWNKIAGAAYLLNTGSRTAVWDDFDPLKSPQLAHAKGFEGSDQAWVSYKLHPLSAHWSCAHGLIKLRWQPAGATTPPPGARLVFTSGDAPPWDPIIQGQWPWVKKHWAR